MIKEHYSKIILNKFLWFLSGVLFTLSISSITYLKKAPIYKFLGLDIDPYDPKVIDHPGNYKWFIPSNNHKIKSLEELKTTREKLRKYIINKSEYSINTIKNLKDNKFESMKNLSEIENIHFKHIKGIDSIVYFFKPKSSNNRLLIFNKGHEGGFDFYMDELSYFLEKGYHILAFDMPLKGTQSKGIYNYKNKLTRSHDALIRFESENKSFISLFVTPVVMGIDYLQKNNKFDSISMTGISGGGWTTVLTAAVDKRINFSFPIAGSLPLDLTHSKDIGDKEQYHYSFYKEYPYMDLYLLGATENNRHQFQINIKKDPCCFSGGRSILYAEYINSLANKFNGNFDVREEKHDQHEVTKSTAKYIHQKISQLTKIN